MHIIIIYELFKVKYTWIFHAQWTWDEPWESKVTETVLILMLTTDEGLGQPPHLQASAVT